MQGSVPKSRSGPRAPGSGHEMIVGQRNIDVFYENLPWGDTVNYFSRDSYATWPVGAGEVLVDGFVVPRGLVLAITSVVFRATSIVDPGPPEQAAFLRDDWFYHLDVNAWWWAFWYVRISGRSIMDRRSLFIDNNAQNSGFMLLNTNIAVDEIPFVIFAKENQRVEGICNVTNVALPDTDALGVEWRGLWIPQKLYNKMKREFTDAK